MLKLLWILLKYLVILPVLLFVFYFGFLQPLSKRLSLLELPEIAAEGFTAFSAFGDFTAAHLGLYRDYYNAWLPEDAAIKAAKPNNKDTI